MKALRGILLVTTITLFVLGACVSTDSSRKKKSPPKEPPKTEEKVPTVQELNRKQYNGNGQAKGNTFLNARNRAIMNAVRNAVVELIGTDREKANSAKLEEARIASESNRDIDAADMTDEEWLEYHAEQANRLSVPELEVYVQAWAKEIGAVILTEGGRAHLRYRQTG